jgi:NAD(P)-dependent dehydrogenase (short-subunit alcohol dehydrogenase family)
MRAVVMGGTSGIGLAVAEAFTEDGVKVTVTGRDPVKLAAADGRFAAAERLDGTDREAVTAFFAGTGPIEHLVLAFSPGPLGFAPVREISMSDVESAFSGKLFGYLHAIREAQVTESVTMISAVSARAALPGTVALAAVNGAIECIVPPLAAELAPVRVNAVSPGVVDTAWWSFLPEDQRQAEFATWGERAPLKRIGAAQDVAAAVRYLVTATFVTGSIMPVDGGLALA